MAGVKGRSGGARSGAGRKKVEPFPVPLDLAQVKDGEPFDPRPTLELIALGHMEASPQQFKALTALLPYTNIKKGDGGKKDEQAGKAKNAASKFAPTAAPKLVVNNR